MEIRALGANPREAAPLASTLLAQAGAPLPGTPTPPTPADQCSVNAWATLEGRGWPDTARAALATILDPPLQVALAQEFERMAQEGVAFERRSMPFVFGASCTPQKALQHALERPSRDLGLGVRLPDGSKMKVETLQDLMAVDLMVANGEGTRFTTAEARSFLALAGQGWTFVRAGEKGGNLSPLEAFNLAGSETSAVHLLGPKGESTRVFRRSDVVAVNYFMGDGQDLGLASPGPAAGLREMEARGFAWGHLSGGWYDQRPVDVYLGDPFPVSDPLYWLARKEDVDERHEMPFEHGRYAMPVSPALRLGAAQRADELEERFRSFQEAANTHLATMDRVRVECGLEKMVDASLEIPWGDLLRGYARFQRILPPFRAPFEQARTYATLLNGCVSAEDLYYRLDYVEEKMAGQPDHAYGAVVADAALQHVAGRRQVQAMAEALQRTDADPPSRVSVDEGTVRIGNLVLPRRAEVPGSP